MLKINFNKTRKYLKLGYKKTGNFLATESYLKTGLFLPRPLKVYYLISNKCNYQCKICPQWRMGQNEQPAEYINEDKMKNIIDEMAELGINEFGVSGGEPLIYKDKMLNLLEYANKKGIYTHFVTNGSLLTEEIIDRYDRSGGGHISLSIDAIGDKHDLLRGYQGAYNNIANVLSIFKKNKYQNIILKINFTLTDANLDEVLAVTWTAIDHGALIFIQPYDTYSYGHKNVEEKEKNFPLWVKKENYGLLKKVVENLAKLKKEYPQVILNDAGHIKAMHTYFTDSNFSTRCLAAFDQIAINPQGQVIFCKYGVVGDFKRENLKSFLQSRKRKEVVTSSLKCQDGCLLGCMFRPSFPDLVINGTKQLFRLIKNN